MRVALGLLAFLSVLVGVWLLQRGPSLIALSPGQVSNQTPQPLALYGKRFSAPLAVTLRTAGAERTLQATVIDSAHAYLRLPADLLGPTSLTLNGDEQSIEVVDDRHFCDPVALAVDAGHAYVVSSTTDELFTIDLETKAVTTRLVDDGPRAIALWKEHVVVVFAFVNRMSLLSAKGAVHYDDVPSGASALWIEGDTGYVAGQVHDEVWAINLPDGRVIWKAKVAPNPATLTGEGDLIVVGSQQSGMVDVLAKKDGALLHRLAPNKQTRISGRTADYSEYVMGGKAVRGLAATKTHIFVSSIGPNVGPNPARLEVTHDAGISVIDRATFRFVRHVGLGAGVTEQLALDEKHDRLYVADIASGLVHSFDLQLNKVASLALAPPDDTALVRPDLTSPNRAGNEVHSGPRALVVSKDGATLYVLNRLSATLVIVDTKTFTVAAQVLLGTRGQQQTRRQGQVLYYGDLGRSGISCDSCHPDGHMDGVFFAKTRPLRIYRASTVRGASLTPPYFVPTSTHTLHETSVLVGNRNRFMRLGLTTDELQALTAFAASIALLPNPNVGADGAPKEALVLPDGRIGHPRDGLVLFEGKAGCAACHKAPSFVATGEFDVGTPRAFPLRAQLQDSSVERFPVPSLLGAWDNFPMLTTGAAGFSVDASEQIVLSDGFVLREALERFDGDKHGHYSKLTASERDDLLAYVLSL